MPKVNRDVMISQAIYAHWAIKTKLDHSQVSVEGLLKDFGSPSDLHDPTAPM